MKTKRKTIIALLLTIVMTMAMAVTSFAAAPQGSLTVTVNNGNSLKDQKLWLYKLFDLTVSDNGENYGYVVNNTYKSNIILAINTVNDKSSGETGYLPDDATSDDMYDAVLALGTQKIQAFANAFTAAALPPKDEKNSGIITTDVTSYTFNDLDYGYYLVYQTGTKELQSSLVSVDKTSPAVDVYLKGTAQTITKTANKETTNIGDVVTYTVTGTIPDTTGYQKYQYIINDTLSDGLDFVTDANGTALTGGAEILGVSVKIGTGTGETRNANIDTDNARKLTLDLSSWVIANQASKGQSFTVTYYARVNDRAEVNNTRNSATLTYGNDPKTTTSTTPVVVDTPTYPLEISKTIKGKTTDNLLGGAIFRLYRSEDDAKNDRNAIKVSGSEGSYIVDASQDAADMVTGGTATNGHNLRLNGLAAGDYWLVETQAPDGYNKLTVPVQVTITKGSTAGDWTVEKDGTEETDKIIDVANSTGTILPGTGGAGTTILSAISILLALVVSASFVISRKKHI